MMDDSIARALIGPSSVHDVNLWFAAWEFFNEWRLARSVVTLNVERKVVVGPDFIHDEFSKLLLGPHPCVPIRIAQKSQAVLDGRSKASAQSTWLNRWRTRWGFSYRALPNRAIMPSDEVFQKVFPNPSTPVSIRADD